MDKQQKWLLRQFHTLCTRLGMTEEEKRALIGGYGVESSKDIDNHDLMDLCHTLELQLNKGAKEADSLRKRVIASIGGGGSPGGEEHPPPFPHLRRPRRRRRVEAGCTTA